MVDGRNPANHWLGMYKNPVKSWDKLINYPSNWCNSILHYLSSFTQNVVPFSKTTPAPYTRNMQQGLWLHDTGPQGARGRQHWRKKARDKRQTTFDKQASFETCWNCQKSREYDWISWMCQSKPHLTHEWSVKQKWWMVFFFTSTTCSSTNFSTDSQNQHPVEPLFIKSHLSFPQAVAGLRVGPVLLTTKNMLEKSSWINIAG